MATPLTASTLLAALRAEGCTVYEYRSWRTHNRNHRGAFGPVHGVMIHHTVTSGTAHSVALCYNGHSTLEGPLCHTVGAKDGGMWMVGHGRANHAGSGDDDVLDAVIDERSLPADNEANTDGNARFYGLELVNLGDGRDPWPRAQYDAAVRWAAGICRAHGWNEHSVVGHKEWQPGKIDPTFDMDRFRADVAERLAHPADWNPNEEDDPMAGFTKQDIYDAVWETDQVAAPDTAADRATNKTWQPQSYLKDIGNRVRRMDGQMVALTEANKRLVDTVAQLAASMGDLDPTAIVAELTSALESIDIHLDVPDQG